jgi:hypothetical protein
MFFRSGGDGIDAPQVVTARVYARGVTALNVKPKIVVQSQSRPSAYLPRYLSLSTPKW